MKVFFRIFFDVRKEKRNERDEKSRRSRVIQIKASPSPSEGGDVLPTKPFFNSKFKVHNSKL